MPISLAFTEPCTFVLRSSGSVTLAETMWVLEQIRSHPRLRGHVGILSDARQVNGLPTTKELRVFACALRSLHAGGVEAMAIVTSSTFVYGVARMFSVFAEPSGVNVSAFRDLDEAQRWLLTETS